MNPTLIGRSLSKLNLVTLASFAGLCLSFIWPSVGLALPKDLTYNTCACFCDGATGGGIIDIRNSGGYSCSAYNNKTCNYEDEATGGIRTGTTKWCGGFKPDGVRAMFQAPLSKDAITRRGVEGDQPAQPGPGPYGPTDAPSEATTPSQGLPSSDVQERAIPRPGLGVAELNCSCDKGSGTCSVTSTDGKSSTCYKGKDDTCTGTCMYPKGTVSGFTGGLMRQ
jgi:hypothetical protein